MKNEMNEYKNCGQCTPCVPQLSGQGTVTSLLIGEGFTYELNMDLPLWNSTDARHVTVDIRTNDPDTGKLAHKSKSVWNFCFWEKDFMTADKKQAPEGS